MRRTLASLTLIPALVASTSMHAQETTTLAALRDHKRVLLIFAGGHDPHVEEQWATMVEHRHQAAERDLTTVLLTRSLVKKHDSESAPSVNFSQSEEQAVRTRFHVKANGFTVILLGNDGGEKLRSNKPFTWQTLQATIDAMPMRQAEMRHTR